MEFLRPPEFINNTAVPFALRACERLGSQPVPGVYDEINQIWKGGDLTACATATVTVSTNGYDGDID
ncbi:MAG: hypothetical protein UV05_C0054G0004 [candidate division CPR1 bacterium GW2011_GWA2_42_17]|uniref:Uncharacterized protein n=1 Tax=candidate division CPR1 bacterium GW2011_GWA2_42_17 TaxID=1618341 RepID=A0A0G1B562_9BACT|nr:MAG: hypothetical protein UV05_C0054G0004 [candidate division CPR1 bacterium GW2011_GWA2_42_17]